MNTSASTTSSHFSLHRVAELYRFNAPRLKKQTAIYLSVSVLSAILIFLGHGHLWQMPVYSVFASALSFMFILAPIIFNRGGDCRIIDRLIPATPTEKSFFYLSYVLVVVPAACYVPYFASQYLYELIYGYAPYESLLPEETISYMKWYAMAQILSSVAAAITCLAIILRAKTSRVPKAVFGAIGVEIFVSAAITFYGSLTAFKIGFEQGTQISGRMSQQEITRVVIDAINAHTPFSIFMFVLIACYIIFMLRMIYTSVYRRNL